MSISKKVALVALLAVFAVQFPGCENRNGKSTSEKIEEAAEEAGDKGGEAADEVGDAAEKTRDETKEAQKKIEKNRR